MNQEVWFKPHKGTFMWISIFLGTWIALFAVLLLVAQTVDSMGGVLLLMLCWAIIAFTVPLWDGLRRGVHFTWIIAGLTAIGLAQLAAITGLWHYGYPNLWYFVSLVIAGNCAGHIIHVFLAKRH